MLPALTLASVIDLVVSFSSKMTISIDAPTKVKIIWTQMEKTKLLPNISLTPLQNSTLYGAQVDKFGEIGEWFVFGGG